MAKLLCAVAFILSFTAYSQEPQTPPGKVQTPKLSDLILKLKQMEISDGPQFEESFNKQVKALENAVEEEKLYCAGETANVEGKVLGKEQKPLCIRELKKQYLEAMDTVFDLKKRYLGAIHKKQLSSLSEIQKKLKEDLEKNF